MRVPPPSEPTGDRPDTSDHLRRSAKTTSAELIHENIRLKTEVSDLAALVDAYSCGCGDLFAPPVDYECENCKTAAWASREIRAERIAKAERQASLMAAEMTPGKRGVFAKRKPRPEMPLIIVGDFVGHSEPATPKTEENGYYPW